MNERIKELKEQAMEWVPNMSDPDTKIRLLNTKKFAELIVRECMEQVWYTREDGINGNVSLVIKDRIKQHFGVEE